MSEPSLKNIDPAYKIGAVERLSGVAATTIRMWERRYKVLEPLRTDTGNRLYSEQDIAKLQLIKDLVDSGHAISTVATLTVEQLQARLSAMPTPAEPAASSVGYESCVLVGPMIGLQWLDDLSIRLLGEFVTVEQCLRAVAEPVDLIIVEAPVLTAAVEREIRQLQRLAGVKCVAVVYDFGRNEYLQNLENAAVQLFRGPISLRQLLRGLPLAMPLPVIESPVVKRRLGDVPEVQFSVQQLGRLQQVNSTIQCECPKHLATLISRLLAFEQYSADCESSSDADAEMHRSLHVYTAKARALMEAGLSELLEHEALSVPK